MMIVLCVMKTFGAVAAETQRMPSPVGLQDIDTTLWDGQNEKL